MVQRDLNVSYTKKFGLELNDEWVELEQQVFIFFSKLLNSRKKWHNIKCIDDTKMKPFMTRLIA